MPSPTDEPAFPADAVEVGRVVDAWGLKGGIKVQAYNRHPQALFSSRRWFLLPPEAPRPASAAAVPPLLRVTQAREQGDVVVASVQDLDDRDAALALRGARVFVSRASFPTPDADEYYWVDLIGLAVHNRDGLVLGQVAGLLDTGANSVLKVQPADPAAAEVLIPFVAAFVDRVDMPGRCIHVDWGPDY